MQNFDTGLNHPFDVSERLEQIRAGLNVLSLSFGNTASVAIEGDNQWLIGLYIDRLKEVIKFIDDPRVRIIMQEPEQPQEPITSGL